MMTKKLVFLFSLVLILYLDAVEAAPAKRLALITPREQNDAFWGPFQHFSEAAAKHFGYKIDTFYAHHDHLQMTQLVEAAMMKKYDGVILSNFKRQGKNAVQLAERYKIPIIMVTGGFEKNEAMGDPRIRYPYWIGQILPDDVQAGKVLFNELLSIYQQRLPNHQPTIFGVEGNIADSGSFDRKKGLMEQLKQLNINYTQVVPANWRSDLAEEHFSNFKKSRYPQIDFVWCASDHMGIGVAQAAKKMQLNPGKDLVIGGVDWSPEGLRALKTEELQVTVGGHLFQGGWAVILFYDYFNGFDFSTERTTFKSEMLALTQHNYNQYAPLLNPTNWQRINFSTFSKAKNSSLRVYDFSYLPLLKAIH